jgi:hypothetical protein
LGLGHTIGRDRRIELLLRHSTLLVQGIVTIVCENPEPLYRSVDFSNID